MYNLIYSVWENYLEGIKPSQVLKNYHIHFFKVILKYFR